jgi:hypothetical protein
MTAYLACSSASSPSSVRANGCASSPGGAVCANSCGARDNLIVAPWVYVQQINQAINEAQPTTSVYRDPRLEVQASMLAAVQQGYTAPFGVQAGLSIKYFFGNGSLSIEDQRWKGTSNLR